MVVPSIFLKDCPEESSKRMYDQDLEEGLDEDVDAVAETGDIVLYKESSESESPPPEQSCSQQENSNYQTPSESEPIFTESIHPEDDSCLQPPSKVCRQDTDDQVQASDKCCSQQENSNCQSTSEPEPISAESDESCLHPPSNGPIRDNDGQVQTSENPQQSDQQYILAGDNQAEPPLTPAEDCIESMMKGAPSTILDEPSESDTFVSSEVPDNSMEAADAITAPVEEDISMDDPGVSSRRPARAQSHRTPLKLHTKHKKPVNLIHFNKDGKPLVPVERDGKVTYRVLRRDARYYKEQADTADLPQTQ